MTGTGAGVLEHAAGGCRERSMLRILTLALAIMMAGCASTGPADILRPESLSPAETEQVTTLLDKLYQSFNYGENEEPDWGLMRSVFVDGAQFSTEPPAGAAPNSQLLEDFISSWQTSIRNSTSSRPSHSEWVTGTRSTRLGQLIRVDVVFQAKKGSDTSPRKPGLDSLVLTQVNGNWKVLSFIVQYESKL